MPMSANSRLEKTGGRVFCNRPEVEISAPRARIVAYWPENLCNKKRKNAVIGG